MDFRGWYLDSKDQDSNLTRQKYVADVEQFCSGTVDSVRLIYMPMRNAESSTPPAKLMEAADAGEVTEKMLSIKTDKQEIEHLCTFLKGKRVSKRVIETDSWENISWAIIGHTNTNKHTFALYGDTRGAGYIGDTPITYPRAMDRWMVKEIYTTEIKKKYPSVKFGLFLQYILSYL